MLYWIPVLVVAVVAVFFVRRLYQSPEYAVVDLSCFSPSKKSFESQALRIIDAATEISRHDTGLTVIYRGHKSLTDSVVFVHYRVRLKRTTGVTKEDYFIVLRYLSGESYEIVHVERVGSEERRMQSRDVEEADSSLTKIYPKVEDDDTNNRLFFLTITAELYREEDQLLDTVDVRIVELRV